MKEIYQRVASRLCEKINQVFESEESLKTLFESCFAKIPFTRTDHWNSILTKVFRDVWYEAGPEVKGEPTLFDKQQVLKLLHPLLDYNLYTQVMLNLQNYVGMAYMTRDAEKDIAALQEKWKDKEPSPFSPKAKMYKAANTEEEKAFNMDLSTLRAMKIIAGFTPMISFRVSPKGSTPAFADSKNMSMIGIGGDKYLRTLATLKPYYIIWEPKDVPLMASHVGIAPLPIVDDVQLQVSELEAPGIPYHFFSKSGGEILNEVLFARKIMYEILGGIDITQKTCIILPRMNSVLVVTVQDPTDLIAVVEKLKRSYPMIRFQEWAR